jgi:hypothetical protein
MVVEDTNGTQIASVDVSDKGSNDVVTFSKINLSAGKTYVIYLKSSNNRDRGYVNTSDFPFVSSDGDLSITGAYFNGSVYTTITYGISEIGNINL